MKNECKDICDWILRQGKEENVFHKYKLNKVEKWILGYTEASAEKDAYNKIKGIEKASPFLCSEERSYQQAWIQQILKINIDVNGTIYPAKIEAAQ